MPIWHPRTATPLHRFALRTSRGGWLRSRRRGLLARPEPERSTAPLQPAKPSRGPSGLARLRSSRGIRRPGPGGSCSPHPRSPPPPPVLPGPALRRPRPGTPLPQYLKTPLMTSLASMWASVPSFLFRRVPAAVSARAELSVPVSHRARTHAARRASHSLRLGVTLRPASESCRSPARVLAGSLGPSGVPGDSLGGVCPCTHP